MHTSLGPNRDIEVDATFMGKKSLSRLPDVIDLAPQKRWFSVKLMIFLPCTCQNGSSTSLTVSVNTLLAFDSESLFRSTPTTTTHHH